MTSADLQKLKTRIAELDSSQWRSSAEIKSAWKSDIIELKQHVTDKMPFYSDTGDYAALYDLSTTDFWAQWQDLPVLIKATFRQRGDQIRTRQVPSEHLPLGSVKTSGSTGIPVEIYGTSVSRGYWAALTVRDHRTVARDATQRYGAIRYLKKENRGEQGIRMPNWGGPVAELEQTGLGFGLHISHKPEVLAYWLGRVNPADLMTYPSVALELLRSDTRPPPALQEINFMAEPLDRELRLELEQEWRVRVSETYSANECGYIAMPCERNRLHVQCETLLFELLNDDDKPCQIGEQGRVVVTTLKNLATPLLRYELGDYATLGEPCDCGRHSPVLENILGRVRNYATAPDGSRFWPGALGKLRTIEPVIQNQFVQVAIDTIDMHLVLARPLTSAEEVAVVTKVRESLGYEYLVNIVPVERIERGPTGKYEEFLNEFQSIE